MVSTQDNFLYHTNAIVDLFIRTQVSNKESNKTSFKMHLMCIFY